MSRPVPIQPPYDDQTRMAQTQRIPTFPPSNYLGRPDQRASGPQLPPIHAMRAAPEDGGRPVQLPPMQIPLQGPVSPPRAPSRSIPVAQLLTSPPSPPRARQPPQAPYQRHFHPAPVTYGSSVGDYRAAPPPQLHPYATQHRLDQIPEPLRQQQYQQQHPIEQYQRAAQHPPPPPVQFERAASHQYSPTRSVFSSPKSYTHSQPSPRSSFPPSSQAGSTPKPKPQPPPLNYNLAIRQQPAAARACGFGERDRRVIDPPPILELKITDQNGLPELDPSGMLALHCTLLNADGAEDETELTPSMPDMPSTRRLMGTLVASPYQAKDENGLAGTFFVFPDLSCRSPGQYRLKFKLIRVDGTNMTCVTTHSSIVSDSFSVYTAKDFPGMRASSSLLKALRRQGLNVGVKKGSEARKGKTKAKKSAQEHSGGSSDGGSDDSDVEMESGSASGSPRVKSGGKKGKRRRRD
ncbi:unnamed protein product [Cercospora beticola]|nr:unnamed protein product [Cercospora beticola]